MPPRFASLGKTLRSPDFYILLSALWVAGCLFGLHARWTGDPNPANGLAWELAAGLPAALWLAALAYSERGASASPVFSDWSPVRIWLLVAAGCAPRLLLLDAAPVHSDDLYRYIWEGRLQLRGLNPFALAPADPALAALRDANWARINYPDMTAIYPPLGQWACAAGAALGEATGAWFVGIKLPFVVADVATIAILAFWLRARGLPVAWAALWAFHPLIVVEFAGNGHLDALAIALLAASLWRLDAPPNDGAKNAALAVTALTGAILAKLTPAVALPFYCWRLGRRWWWLAAVPVVFVLAWLPFADAGWSGMTGSAGEYLRRWEFNGPAFALLRWALGDDSPNGIVSRRVVFGGLLALAAFLWVRKTCPLTAGLALLGYYVASNPVVHPWYAAIVLMLALAHGRTWIVLPWTWLCWALPLTYLLYVDPAPGWVPWAVWGPFYGLLAGGAAWRACVNLSASRRSR